MSISTQLISFMCTGVVCCVTACAFGQAAFAGSIVFPGDRWEERTPDSQGINGGKLQVAMDFLEGKCGAKGISEIVIVRNGYLILKGSNIDRKHCVWSATKSFTSTVLGHLIHKGACTLDTKASKHIPALAEKYPDVTLRHFATMTSGYDGMGGSYGESDPDDGSHTPLYIAAPVFAPGAQYSYFDDAMRMNGYILTKIAGQDLDTCFREHVARAIGMPDSSWEWAGKPQAHHKDYDWSNPEALDVRDAAGGMRITARALARFGLLMLNRGTWDGRQIISAEWVDEATRVQVPPTMPGRMDTSRQQRLSADGPGRYGYNWWANGIGNDGQLWWPGMPAGAYAASGYNHNYCAVIPQWRMVIVRMNTDPDPEDWTQSWKIFLEMVGDAVE